MNAILQDPTPPQAAQRGGFPALNGAYRSVFQPGRLTLGLVVPIEAYPDQRAPTMARHLERAQLAESLGFAALWLRDVPFDVPSFGDAGQVFDPFVYLGLLAGRTQHIALGLASAILPLRHPAHLAKAAASVDALSGGRVLLGIASGDRPDEYPAFGASHDDRGKTFREAYEYMERVWRGEAFFNGLGSVGPGLRLLPTPAQRRVPMLITGASQQSAAWIAERGDGWMVYPGALPQSAQAIAGWRARVVAATGNDKPVMQPLYLDLTPDELPRPQPIHLGYRMGLRGLRDHLRALSEIGVNHVAINLRFSSADVESVMERIASGLLDEFGTLRPTLGERLT